MLVKSLDRLWCQQGCARARGGGARGGAGRRRARCAPMGILSIALTRLNASVSATIVPLMTMTALGIGARRGRRRWVGGREGQGSAAGRSKGSGRARKDATGGSRGAPRMPRQHAPGLVVGLLPLGLCKAAAVGGREKGRSQAGLVRPTRGAPFAGRIASSHEAPHSIEGKAPPTAPQRAPRGAPPRPPPARCGPARRADRRSSLVRFTILGASAHLQVLGELVGLGRELLAVEPGVARLRRDADRAGRRARGHGDDRAGAERRPHGRAGARELRELHACDLGERRSSASLSRCALFGSGLGVIGNGAAQGTFVRREQGARASVRRAPGAREENAGVALAT